MELFTAVLLLTLVLIFWRVIPAILWSIICVIKTVIAIPLIIVALLTHT